MIIIAQTKKDWLIEASYSEVQAILTAVSGVPTEAKDIKVGQKIPAIDYASTITELKAQAIEKARNMSI